MPWLSPDGYIEKVMPILGLNAIHAASAACIVRDGVSIAAVEGERFRRIKHWSGFPTESIRYCLKEAGATITDIDFTALNQDSKANIFHRIEYSGKSRPDSGLLHDKIRTRKERSSAEKMLEAALPGRKFGGQVTPVKHHLAHLSSAFRVSPFEEAVSISVDGFGDLASVAWGVGHGGVFDIKNRVYFPHSLEIFYQAITQYLGFPRYDDKYNVTSLAPYGEPRYRKQMRALMQLQDDRKFMLNVDCLRHHQESVPCQWESGSPRCGTRSTWAAQSCRSPF